jgi:hypothetical protein
MARLSLLALLALAFSGVASAAPALGGLSARDNQSFKPCGTWILASQCPTSGTQRYHHTGGSGTILSVNISPDPPVAGEELEVFVTASTFRPITVSRPSYCGE